MTRRMTRDPLDDIQALSQTESGEVCTVRDAFLLLYTWTESQANAGKTQTTKSNEMATRNRFESLASSTAWFRISFKSRVVGCPVYNSCHSDAGPQSPSPLFLIV